MSRKHYIILSTLIIFLLMKHILGFLNLAENGDTYDFFKAAYYLKEGVINYPSKRMPFLPALLSFANPDYFVFWGRVIINLFYFLLLVFSYKYFKLFTNNNQRNYFYSLCFTLAIAFNFVIFENSFYILADTIFLFFNLLFLYTIKKYNLSKPILLALISALSFYTRPEGILLFLITGILYLISFTKAVSKVKSEKLKVKQILSQTITYGVVGLIFIAPYFFKNYYYYGSVFYSGYFSDQAGFLFSYKSTLEKIGNFVFGVGGVWLLPFLYLLAVNQKLNVKGVVKSYLPEILLFIFYSAILFIWGPYLRLYSIPIFITLTLVFVFLTSFKQTKVNTKNILIVLFLYIVSSAFYLYLTQILDIKDLGYFKYSTLSTVILSLPVLIYPILYLKNKINKKTFLILFTVTVILINLFLFIDKFRVTRYKYYTIKQAVEYVINVKQPQENVFYESFSAVEIWYLKDFDEIYYYKQEPQAQVFLQQANEKQVKYIITTDEIGFKSKLSQLNKQQIGAKLIKEYKSPFFAGSTKVYALK